MIVLVLLSAAAQTRVTIAEGRWLVNNRPLHPGARAAGLLMNVRMVNAGFEDANPKTCPAGFDPEANTDAFIAAIPDYAAHGVDAFTLSLQGGSCGTEGAVNSAFTADGSLRDAYLRRVRRVIEACDRNGVVVILTCYYQRQDQILRDADAVRAGVVNAARWILQSRFGNVVLEIANEYGHGGFDHALLKTPAGQTELIGLAKRTAPSLLVSTSPTGGGRVEDVAPACDFLLVHLNNAPLEEIAGRIAPLKKFGKPVVCNEDDRPLDEMPRAAERCVIGGAAWGLMLVKTNQHFPFTWRGAEDAPDVYATLKHLTTPDDYFPPPESAGGWRTLDSPNLDDVRKWLLASDERDFAAVVVHRGRVVLQVERGNNAATDARRVASVSKAICATVLAIASERNRKMTFDSRAFDFIPWAHPLSDPRKADITVRQLLNHTSGLCPEATGAENSGTWQFILGHSGDARTEKLAFAPGAGCGYSTHALDHAALVCEAVTGKPYDEFAVEALFKPLGIEHWTFTHHDGDAKHGRHASHSLGLPARALARIAYCMSRGGRWEGRQVIPEWFVRETAAPTHAVTSPEMRWGLNAQIFSHGWELPAKLDGAGGRRGDGIPADTRSKPGSGGQLMAFVPSLDLVVTRQTGSSGGWDFEEYVRRACAAVQRR